MGQEEILESRDIEFNSYAEMKAFLRGFTYEHEGEIDVWAFSFSDDARGTGNGKYRISLTGEPRQALSGCS